MAAAVILLAGVPLLGAADLLSIQVKSTKLRSAPKFWAASVADLSLGDKVSPGRTQGDWIQATASGRTGWLHRTAVTSKDIVLSGGGSTVASTTSTEDVSMAGKGFNRTVETEYGSSRGVNFGGVDAMSEHTVTPAELETFLREGKLAEWGAAR
jgi:hypothetical protein